MTLCTSCRSIGPLNHASRSSYTTREITTDFCLFLMTPEFIVLPLTITKKRDLLAVTFERLGRLPRVRQFSASSVDPVSGHPEDFRGFPQLVQEKCGAVF